MRTTCDVLIVGAGPAGSACARDLVRAGFDVVVVERAALPRDKPCAGWITPEVVRVLELDLEDYRRSHVLQPIEGFEVGVLGGPRARCRYATTVSYAIRRCEFDTYLARRAGARLIEGVSVDRFERVGDRWRVNDRFEASVVVGAGGHFCPVARVLNPAVQTRGIVAARVVELVLETPGRCPVDGTVPELYFWPDLRGYGWCVRKDGVLNVGFGHLDAGLVAAATRSLVDVLERRGRLPAVASASWKGHAYRVGRDPARRLVGDGMLLVGDAAGLALPASGEGILPAVLSGRLAADAIAGAAPAFQEVRLAPYVASLERHLPVRDRRSAARRAWEAVAPGLAQRCEAWCGARLLGLPWFARRVVLDRWFLHREGLPGRW